MSARRDLGPEYEDAVVESFLDKMGEEIDRRVDQRLAQAAPAESGRVVRQGSAEGHRLALAIVSLALGTIATALFVLFGEKESYVIPVWIGIIVVNAVYNSGRKG